MFSDENTTENKNVTQSQGGDNENVTRSQEGGNENATQSQGGGNDGQNEVVNMTTTIVSYKYLPGKFRYPNSSVRDQFLSQSDIQTR